jgi:16S rRNA processing protein RimM
MPGNDRARNRSLAPEPGPGFVAVGRVLGAHGVRGDLKVEPLAPAKQLARGRAVRLAGREATIERARGHGRGLLLKLSGIDDRETAAALRDEYLQVPEASLDALPEGEYYRFQLIGLRVVSAEGRDLGRIQEVLATPENDVYVVQGPAGEVLVPAIEDIVQAVDLESGVVTVEVVPGLLPG